MDVYIARQPIFDRKMRVFGYELLYRKSDKNSFIDTEDDQATAEVLYNCFLVIGIDDLTSGTKAFINFSKELIDSDVPLLLPKESVIFEVLEREKATQSTIDACARIRNMGYRLALDDFVIDSDNLPLIDYADIVKIEYPAVSIIKQRDLLKKYKPKIKFLAEKIETREDYYKARELGYDYFQGYFFSKPAMINTKEILTLNTTLFNIIDELNKPEPDFSNISELISRDLGLSYKLLKLANSVYIGARSKVKTIMQALTTLGTRELYQWISLMLIKDIQNVENTEMIKQSLIRGKLMSLLAYELRKKGRVADYFFVGIFSMIDILLNKRMDEILSGLLLPDDVKDALIGIDSELRQALNYIISFEQANWDDLKHLSLSIKIDTDKFMTLYINALKWADTLDY